MFNLLKNKLKGWVDKAKEVFTKKEETEEPQTTKEEKLPFKETISEKPKEKKKEEKPISKESIKKPSISEKKSVPEKPILKEKEIVHELQPEKKQEELKKEVITQEHKTPKAEIKKQQITGKEVVVQKEEKESQSIFQRIKSAFTYRITKEDLTDLLDDLEMSLLENNVALEAVEKIKEILQENLVGKEIKKDTLDVVIKTELKNALKELLIEPDDILDIIKLKKEKPFVIVLCGINGTGKTTTTAKLVHLLKKNNHNPVIAAADTFRAASIEQIAEHAQKLEVQLIKHTYGSDPAAVGFDAIKYAKKHNHDVVIIDTAGRMHTKTNLLNEMEKIIRITKPDLTLFVAEAIAGNDAVEQAKTFSEIIPLDGSILSKTDIDEKGGTIISISHATHKPIFFLGTGQGYDDLKPFNKEEFIKSLGLD